MVRLTVQPHGILSVLCCVVAIRAVTVVVPTFLKHTVHIW